MLTGPYEQPFCVLSKKQCCTLLEFCETLLLPLAHGTSKALHASSESQHRCPRVAFILFGEIATCACLEEKSFVFSRAGDNKTISKCICEARPGARMTDKDGVKTLPKERWFSTITLSNQCHEETRPHLVLWSSRIKASMKILVANPRSQREHECKGNSRAMPARSANMQTTAKK